jgi:hypothetical protein
MFGKTDWIGLYPHAAPQEHSTKPIDCQIYNIEIGDRLVLIDDCRISLPIPHIQCHDMFHTYEFPPILLYVEPRVVL